MNQSASLAITILKKYKTYGAVAAAVTSGLGMILAKDYNHGLETICQALLVFFSGASAVGLHAAASMPRGV